MAGERPIHKIAVLVASVAVLGGVAAPASGGSNRRVRATTVRIAPHRVVPQGLARGLLRTRDRVIRVEFMLRGHSGTLDAAFKERAALAAAPTRNERAFLRSATKRALSAY